jgi:hypothetical protein
MLGGRRRERCRPTRKKEKEKMGRKEKGTRGRRTGFKLKPFEL